MSRFEVYQRESEKLITFHCPGCKGGHAFRVAGGPGPVWTWNGELDKATFSPSLLYHWDDSVGGHPVSTAKVCHSFVREGKIEFLGDCTHELRGQTVDVPENT